MENNCIEELPEEIAHIPFLNVIKLKGNPLSKQFQNLNSLKFSDNLQDALNRCF